MDDLVRKISNILQPILDEYECDLVDIEVKGKSSARTIKVYVDKIGGISIQICTRITKQLRNIFELDEEQLKLGNYRIEVSSPGIDRPLETLRDFERHIGKLIEFKLSDMPDASIEGELVKIEENVLKINRKGEVVPLPFDSIKSGKIKIQWKS